MPAKTSVMQSHVQNKANYHKEGLLLFFSLLVVALGIIKIPIHLFIFMFYYCNTLDNLGTVVSEV